MNEVANRNSVAPADGQYLPGVRGGGNYHTPKLQVGAETTMRI